MGIPCPEKFSFEAEKWPAWKQRFQRFRTASDLGNKSQERQVSMLLYSMGEKTEHVFNSFNLTTDEAKTYKTVFDKFDSHFVISRNIIFEKTKFNSRRQEEEETVEAFITALHKLSETCEFGDLKNELIRDRIVVEIGDGKLSEKLQLDKDLTLEAIFIVRQAEQVRQQQGVLRRPPQTASDINTVRMQHCKHPNTKNTRGGGTRQQQKVLSGQRQECKWCGRTPKHDREQCPARNTTCHTCHKKGHFGAVYRSKQVHEVFEEATHNTALRNHADAVFLDTVNTTHGTKPWTVNVNVNKTATICFKLYTGADVLVISSDNHTRLGCKLSKSDKALCSPGQNLP